ncbi:MAG TPA: LUD domain-containing protein [Trebonia sp.]|jgi:L-lactate dehydrogenase complex protein LldG|nr:LUD domain-containing protein [Trebonia sp.]
MSAGPEGGSARAQILARVRAANGPARDASEVDRAYAELARPYRRAHHDPAATDIVALFAERAADYRAVVERVPAGGLAAAIGAALATAWDGPQRTVLVPAGVPEEWLAALPEATTIARDAPPLAATGLDGLPAVLTGCAAAIAETGTVVLDHGPAQGRRALTLVPDFHVVVVEAAQVAPDIAEALERLDPARPVTFISGPSATSDIELIRVEGVHGPRTLHILIA